jgi:hypothetical protein
MENNEEMQVDETNNKVECEICNQLISKRGIFHYIKYHSNTEYVQTFTIDKESFII